MSGNARRTYFDRLLLAQGGHFAEIHRKAQPSHEVCTLAYFSTPFYRNFLSSKISPSYYPKDTKRVKLHINNTFVHAGTAGQKHRLKL